MLIGDEIAGIEGKAADAASQPISLASLPALLLGGLLLLIGP
jgi:hypothetical protein